MRAAGIPAAHSHYAGSFLCNQSLYLALEHTARRGFPDQATFVHIPVLPEQVLGRWPQAPFMPLEMLRSAVRIILGSIR